MLQRRALVALSLALALLLPAMARTAAAQPGGLQSIRDHIVQDEQSVRPANYESQPRSVNGCTDLVTDAMRLDREVTGLEPNGALGRPRLCLMYAPNEDIYQGVLVAVEGVEGFRAAKADALRRLGAAGFDPCGIATWDAYGRFSRDDRMLPSDLLDLPVQCRPRVLAGAGDAGAERWVGAVRDAVDKVGDLTADQLGWRPNRALTVAVFTDAAAAADFYEKTRAADESPEDVARAARGGRSFNRCSYLSIYGCLIAVNLVQRDTNVIITKVAHEYTHFAQGGIGGSASVFPLWFVEGQGEYQEARNGITRFDDVGTARKAQLEGTALRLADIARRDDWDAHEQREGGRAVYSRGFVAIAFLGETYGADALVSLLRANRNGSLDGFNDALMALTGLDIDGFNDALGDWLLTIPWYVARTDAGNLRFEYTVSPDRTLAQGAVINERPLVCVGADRALRAGATIPFRVNVGADGAFSGISAFDTTLVTVEGALFGDSAIQGTLRMADPERCDTGQIAVAAYPTLVAGASAAQPVVAEVTGPVNVSSSPAPAPTPMTPAPPSSPTVAAAAPAPALFAPNAHFAGADADGFVSIQFTTSADGARIDGVLRVVRAIPCGVNAVRAGQSYNFTLAVRSDGAFAGRTTQGTALVTLEGRLFAAGEARGTFQYQSTDTGCDTGRVGFVARPQT